MEPTEPTILLQTSLVGSLSTEIKEPKQNDQKREWRQHLVVLMPILIVYFLLALYRIDYQSLWGDEVLSLKYAAPNGPLFTHAIWFRGQGPFYFVLLHLWAKWATSEFVLRLLAALIGAVAIYLIYVLGLRLCNQRTATIASILFASSPFLIWYSQEVRYITLMIATSLLAMYTFRRASSAVSPAWWIAYSCSLILAFAAFLSNILLPVAQGLYLLCSPARRQVLSKWLVYQVLAFIPFIWWANGGHFLSLGGHWQDLLVEITESDEEDSPLEHSQGLSTGGPREFTPAVLPYTFYAFSSGFSLGPSTRELHWSRSLATLAPHASLLLLLCALFGGLFILGLYAVWSLPDNGLFLTLWLVIPILGVFGVSGVTHMTYNVRYVAMVLPAFIFILVAGILSLKRTVIQIALLGAVLLVNGIALANYYFDPRYSREDVRAAAQYLQSATRPSDIILIVGSTTALRHYYKGNLPIVSWGRQAINDSPILTERLQRLRNAHNCLWLVSVRSWQTDPKGKVKAALDQVNAVIQQRNFPGVDIYCYQVLKKNRNLFSTTKGG